MDPQEIAELKGNLATLPLRHDFKYSPESRKRLFQYLGYYISGTNPKILSKLYSSSNAESCDSLDWKLQESQEPHYHDGRPCSKSFLKGDPCYRCLTCGHDESCALCAYCFNSQDHKNHVVHKSLSQRDNSGVCDCGDPEAWNRDINCKYSQKKEEDDISPDEQQRIANTLSTIVDYILDVMSNSTSVTVPLSQPDQIRESTLLSVLSATSYMTDDIACPRYALILYNDQIHQSRDAIQRVHVATGKVIEFAKMVVDRVNTYGKAVVMTSENLEYLIEKQKVLTSTSLAASIKNCRDVFKEEVSDELIYWLLDFTKTDLFLNSKIVQDTFCKVFLSKRNFGSLKMTEFTPAAELDPVLKERLKNISLTNDNEIPYFYHNVIESIKEPWEVPRELIQECEYTYQETLTQTSFVGSRFQYLLFFDIRFCKLARSKLHDLYIISLISNLKYKLMVTIQYIDIYPQLAKLFLIFDREPEISILPALSVQLFTCPSSCTIIARHGDLYRMLLLVYSYLSASRKIEKQEEASRYNRKMLYQSLKNRKWGHIFLDMTYIINRTSDHLVVFSPYFNTKVIEVLLLFQSNPCMKREASSHIEYESTDYGLYFNAMSVISHFSETLGKAANKIPLAQSHFITTFTESILITLGRFATLSRSTLTTDTNDSFLVSDKEDPVLFHKVNLIDGDHEIIACNVMSDKVSLLHPLHSLLSWLIEFNKEIKTVDDLKTLFNGKILKDSMETGPEGSLFKTVMDFPLRTMVLLSQIKVGLWVRNGLSVKNQMNIYKSSGIREFGYSRDLFLVQTFLAAADPEATLPTIIDRWGMTNWSNNKLELNKFDGNFTELLEEFVLFNIHILTEDLHLHSRSSAEVLDLKIKREIVQTLCFKPMSYGALVSEIPEHVAAEKRFFVVFQSVTQEVANSSSLKESKVYELRPELFDEVDPYYVHYTSNKREDVIKILKKRKQKSTSLPFDQVVLNPRCVNWELSPFKNLINITSTKLFVSNIQRACQHSIIVDQSSDSLIDLTLHLIHICVTLPNQSDFIFSLAQETNVIQFLYDILSSEDKKRLHSEVRVILQRIYQVFESSDKDFSFFVSSYDKEVIYPSRISDTASQEMEEKKRRLLKKKKKLIMARMKKQQEEFAQNNINVGSMDTSDDDLQIGDKCDSNVNPEGDITGWPFPVEHCILCQMPASKDELFGIISNIGQSNEFRTVPFEDEYWFYKSFSDGYNLNEEQIHKHDGKCIKYLSGVEKRFAIGPGFPANDYDCQSILPVVSSCCHGMHFSCFTNFVQNFKSRQATQITRTIPEDTQRGEFLCPLCKAVNNVFIPIFYSSNNSSFETQLAKSSEEVLLEKDLTYTILEHQNKIVNRYSKELILKARSSIQSKFLSENDSSKLIRKKVSAFLHHNMELMSSLIVPYESLEALVANTIKSVEISLRGVPTQIGSAKSILTQLSNQTLTQLRVWNQYKEVLHIDSIVSASTENGDFEYTNSGGEISNSELNYCELSLGLLVNLDKDMSLLYEGEDLFKFLVSIDPIDSLGITYHFLIEYIFSKHIIQSLLLILARLKTYRFDIEQCSLVDLVEFDDFDLTQEDYDFLGEIFFQFSGTRIPPNDLRLAKVVYGMLIKLVTPFLRCVAIYSYIKFAVINEENWDRVEEIKLEADQLSFVLNIPTTLELLKVIVNKKGYDIFRPSEDDIARLLIAKIPYPGVIRLINLPDKIFEFFVHFNDLKKDNNNSHLKKISDPAICLFCSEIVGLQVTKLGEKYGSCNMHANTECMNGGLGIFLIPRSNSLLLLNKSKGSFFESPYIDDHGDNETDSKRGHDLHLSKAKYDEICRNMWLCHNIPNQIARKLESQMDIGGWQTL